MRQTNAKPEDIEKCASIWFLRLERAREHGDKDSEKEARQKLREMGVDVKFRRSAQQ